MQEENNMTKLQKQKHINGILEIIKSIKGIEETRFGNFRLKEKNISFFIKDNNLRIERNEFCIFSEPWVRITSEGITRTISKIII
jgi:hypothetical protein